MFDLGLQELIIIFVVALIVFGPKKLPELARMLGRGMGELKRAMHGIKDTLEEADIRESVRDKVADFTLSPPREESDNSSKNQNNVKEKEKAFYESEESEESETESERLADLALFDTGEESHEKDGQSKKKKPEQVSSFESDNEHDRRQ